MPVVDSDYSRYAIFPCAFRYYIATIRIYFCLSPLPPVRAMNISKSALKCIEYVRDSQFIAFLWHEFSMDPSYFDQNLDFSGTISLDLPDLGNSCTATNNPFPYYQMRVDADSASDCRLLQVRRPRGESTAPTSQSSPSLHGRRGHYKVRVRHP